MKGKKENRSNEMRKREGIKAAEKKRKQVKEGGMQEKKWKNNEQIM